MVTILITIVAAAVIGFLAHLVLFLILGPILKRTPSKIDDHLVKYWRAPARYVIIALAVTLALPLAMRLQPEASAPAQQFSDGLLHVFTLVLIACVAWLVIRTTRAFEDYLLDKFDVNVKENLRARTIHTQFRVFKRIIIFIVIILAVGLMLMTLPQVRHLGTSILASAGIVGLIVGFAAQKSLATLLAGIQLAITQPIRLDDVVIVENEWGRIEEITLTYVVVRIWDLRRLVLPITYFIDKPFQNWTRATADILGTVFLYTDYTVPVGTVRVELERILKNSPHWDGKVCVLQITNATERTVELRALMSAADASIAWNLRCEVREKLIGFIQQNFPQALPKTRAVLDQPPPDQS